MEKTAMPHRLKEAKMSFMQNNFKILWLPFIKLLLILTGTGQLNKDALSALYKAVVTPVEKHAPTNELISDMNCGVYVRGFAAVCIAFLHCSRLDLGGIDPL